MQVTVTHSKPNIIDYRNLRWLVRNKLNAYILMSIKV